MKFGGKHTVQSKSAAVESRYGTTTGASKGKAPLPKPTFKMRPTGGLKPDGFKVKAELKF